MTWTAQAVFRGWTKRMAIRAVLFDFDGVLADTENHHVAAWQRTLAALGWSVPDEVAVRAAEIDDREFLGEVFRARGVDNWDTEGWLVKKQQLAHSLLKDSPRVYPGVHRLVSALRDRVALAVVTGTTRRNVEIVLESSGLAESFPLIVSKEDVEYVKPAADAYLAAIERLGVAASESVALEDSPSGIESATTAGIRAIAIGHRRSAGAWTKGLPYLENLESTSTILELLGI